MSRWRNLTLRGRLSVLTAAVVSVAVVLCCSLAWFAAQHQMSQQVDDTLKQNWTAPGSLGDFQLKLREWCNAPAQPFERVSTSATLVTAGGAPNCVTTGSSVKPTSADEAVAAASADTPSSGNWTIHDGRTNDGTPVRVYTVGIGQVTYNGPNGSESLYTAVSFAQPLKPLRDALFALAVILLFLALIVIAGAVIAAWYVAKTGLKPVDKLTAAVEHIARTEEVGTTIDVAGDDEIARLSASFNSMSTALASSRERQSQLIADAGHELRTPLTSLRTNVDLLVRSQDAGRPLPPETHTRLLRNMKAQMGELSTLIGDLLELSRPTRPKGSKPLEVIALHDIVARALDRARLRGPGLEFTVQVEPWYVRADAHALERAVINLLDNAVKFSPAGGTVDVALKFGTLTVRDHGPGIPEEDLPHVFERFWRSPSARQMPGSGLGLAIVSQTVHDHGGEVSLSNAHPGTLATLVLPGAPTPPPELPIEV